MAAKKKLYLCDRMAVLPQVGELSDDELLKLLRKCNPLAQGECFRRRFKPIFQFVRRNHARRNSVEDSEEITSASLYTVLVFVHQYDGKSTFMTWMFSIAKYRATDHYARPGKFHWIRKPGQSRRPSDDGEKPSYPPTEDAYNSSESKFIQYDSMFSAPGDIHDPLGRANDPTGDVEERSEDLKDQYELDLSKSGLLQMDQGLSGDERLERRIYRLGADQYIVIHSVDVKGLTLEETANWMRRSPDSVRKLYQRAKRKLEAILKDDPHFNLLMPKIGNAQINDFIEKKLFEESLRNISSSARSSGPAPKKVIYKHDEEYQAHEKQRVPYVEFTTYELFFRIHSSQGQTLGEWLNSLKYLSTLEIERLSDVDHATIESVLRSALQLCVGVKEANRLPERARSPRREEVRIYPVRSSYQIGDVLLASAILPRPEEDESNWVSATDLLWYHKELEWQAIDSIDEMEMPSCFTQALKSTLAV